MMTNFEKIKNMSVGNLTKLIISSPCRYCVNYNDCLDYYNDCLYENSIMSCEAGVKQWLESEVKNNETTRN